MSNETNKAKLKDYGKSFDTNIYGQEKQDEYDDELRDEEEDNDPLLGKKRVNSSKDKYSMPEVAKQDMLGGIEFDPLAHAQKKSIAANESDYNAKRLKRPLSPSRYDAFDAKKGNSEGNERTYKDIINEQRIDSEMSKKPQKQEKNNVEVRKIERNDNLRLSHRLDEENKSKSSVTKLSSKDDWEQADVKGDAQWGNTPKKEQTPMTPRTKRWNLTPSDTPRRGIESSMRSKSKWDETPKMSTATQYGNTPSMHNMFGLHTPTPDINQHTPLQMTPSAYLTNKLDKEMQYRNRHLTDDEINSLLPDKGFEVLN